MESLVTELVWLVTNYQAWVVGVLLFGDPHVWYRRYSFFEILALCKDAGTAPATRRKNFCFATSRVRVGAPLPSHDRRRCRFVEQTLRAAALPAAATPLPLVPSLLTGVLHARRRIAGVLVVLVT